MMFQVSNERFEELAAEAVASLPESLSSRMDNVAIIVEDEAQGRNLFGLYEGIPLTRRGFTSYNGGDARSHHAVSDDHLPGLRQRGRRAGASAQDGDPRDRPPLRHQRSPSRRTGLGVTYRAGNRRHTREVTSAS